MITIERGNTKKIQVNFYDEDSALVDPDAGSGKIAIYFQDGTSILAATVLTQLSTGTFFYRWATTSSNSIGIYHLEVTATFGSQTFTNRDSIYLTDVISGD